MLLSTSFSKMREVVTNDFLSCNFTQRFQNVSACPTHMKILHFNEQILYTHSQIVPKKVIKINPNEKEIFILKIHIQYHQLMNNKKTISQQPSSNEDVDIICQQIHKNKQQIQLFYARNKMKFPPILQSRNIIFKQKLSNYLEIPSEKGRPNENRKSQHSESSVQKVDALKMIEQHPSICSIKFSKSKDKKIDPPSAPNTGRNERKISFVSKTNSTPKKYYLSLEKSKDLKFLNEPSSKDATIEQFLSEMMKNKSSAKKTTFILAKSFQIDKRTEPKRNDPLVINRITPEPQASLLNTFQLHAKRMTIEYQPQTERKPSLPKTFRNVSYYNNQNHTSRRRLVSQRRERFFQPWQYQSPIQDDEFGESKA